MTDAVDALVVGATGFIGSHLVAHLKRSGRVVAPASIRSESDGSSRPHCAEVLFHVAGLAHAQATAAEHYEGTITVAKRTLALADIVHPRAIVMVSSILVYPRSERLVTVDSAPHPQSAYALAKLAAEDILLASPHPTVVVRVPPVYGRGARNSVAALARFARRGVPLPVPARTDELRSVVSVRLLSHLLLDVAAQKPRDRIEIGAETSPTTVAELAHSFTDSPRLIRTPGFVRPGNRFVDGTRLEAALWGPVAIPSLRTEPDIERSCVREDLLELASEH